MAGPQWWPSARRAATLAPGWAGSGGQAHPALPTWRPQLMPSLHCHSVPRVCPAAGLSAEPRARVCPPQTQRWRSENFERPVDLEGSGDDDAFPDDELDDLYSGSGSGCEYLPPSFSLCVCRAGHVRLPPEPHTRLISGSRTPCKRWCGEGRPGRGLPWTSST